MTEGKTCAAKPTSFVKNISVAGRLSGMLMGGNPMNVAGGYPWAMLAKRHDYSQRRIHRQPQHQENQGKFSKKGHFGRNNNLMLKLDSSRYPFSPTSVAACCIKRPLLLVLRSLGMSPWLK